MSTDLLLKSGQAMCCAFGVWSMYNATGEGWRTVHFCEQDDGRIAYLTDNYHQSGLTGIFWRSQFKLNNNKTSALVATVAGSSRFKTEQMIKNDKIKLILSLNKGKLCNWKLFYINSGESSRQNLKCLFFLFTVY